MGRNCAVAGCNNSAKTGHTQHAFPKDDRQRNLWVRFVKLTRVDFTVPTKHSAICSEHFSEECYEVDRLRFKELFGLSAHARSARRKTVKKLENGSKALPTICTVAASTPNGDSEEMVSKWLSVATMCRTKHRGHSDQVANCLHGELVGHDRKKIWLKPGTKAYDWFLLSWDALLTASCCTAFQRELCQTTSSYKRWSSKI
ncbi:unnamed protein product [Mytilus edulis]|uniref:THAP-type domain-containing protein n=1 Tax=Mytilus edulis TaxID=6550 RepID=A0A8S3RZD4_MYTED|nr:unnamed protein product [Mytilus edulis]